MARFAACIFLSAFLLFQVQPFVCKVILPWFGGASSVWATCVAFFQTLLFGGYLYAHLSATHLSRKMQGYVHAALILISFVFLPVLPSDVWKPTGGESPLWRIVLLLAATVGLPFFVLAANGPLVQSWFARERPGHSPYRLYALSNFGSLLALGTYPFLVEPMLKLREQSWAWSGLYVLFGLLCAWCALAYKTDTAPVEVSAESGAQILTPVEPTTGERLLWILLPACASMLLVASTNTLSQDVAVVPFLWVLPLSIYLLSFIFTFDSDRWYYRPAWGVALVVTLGGAYAALYYGVDMNLPAQIAVHTGVLLTCCMICHGELVRLKPHPKYLTSFYLMLSAGGAIGGIAVTFGAPFVFVDIVEYPIGILLCAALFLVMLCRDPQSPLYRLQWPVVWVVMLVAWMGSAAAYYMLFRNTGKYSIASTRNFYGVLKVNDHPNYYPPHRTLMHGRINHGSQYLVPEYEHTPVTYYGEESGVGVSVRILRDFGKPLHIGVVGLGTGTMAAWGRKEDTVRFYDINPQVIDMSDLYFTYTGGAECKVEKILGDARLMIEREVAAGNQPPLDLLAMDAFTGDAIPLHLLTVEAFESYWKRVRPDGIIAVHISNRYLSLFPLVQGLAQATGREAIFVEAESGDVYESNSWVLVTNNKEYLNHALMKENQSHPPSERAPLVFTDDYSNLFKILKW